jgi:hypothetical protein
MKMGISLVALLMGAAPAAAQDLLPMNTAEVEEGMLLGVFGPWHIKDETGGKDCKVLLREEPAIGGRGIEIDPACEKLFPVMGNVAAWQLMDGWAIDLIGVDRKRLIRFTTPDERYIATPETDGISTIEMEFQG